MFESYLNDRDRLVVWPLWASIFGLMLFGAAFIYSATSIYETSTLWQRFQESSLDAFVAWLGRQLSFKQILFYCIGLAVAAGICFFDFRRLARWSMAGYWFSILLLVLVLIPAVGVEVFGARRWINLGVFQFQPSEFAKLTFLFALGHFLSRPQDQLQQPSVFFKSLALTLLPFVLILKEPDLGSALVLLPIYLVMVFVAGVPLAFLGRLVGGVGLLVILMVVNILFAPKEWRIPLEEYQRHRLLVYFGRDFAEPNATPAERKHARLLQEEKRYNVKQALISVGSGGWTGKGWREGTQTGLGYLPPVVARNDFIFSVIAEEKGFLGSLMVLFLYTVLLFTGIRIASQARDRLGKVLAIGVVTMLFSHVFINIGMNIRLMPVTGIPLPLLSYGGTSVLCSLIAAGILQNIHIYRRSY